jgi:hypothetical protein
LGNDPQQDASQHWGGPVVEITQDPIPKNAFLSSLSEDPEAQYTNATYEEDGEDYDGSDRNDDSDDEYAHQRNPTRHSEMPALSKQEKNDAASETGSETKTFDLRGQVEYWSDYLKPFFHPRTILTTPSMWSEDQHLFGTFWEGHRYVRDSPSFVEDVDDSIRYMLEECDNIRALSVSVDADSGFTAVAHQVLQAFGEDNPKVPILVQGIQFPTILSMTRSLHQRRGGDAEEHEHEKGETSTDRESQGLPSQWQVERQMLNATLGWERLLEHCSSWCPMSLRGEGEGPAEWAASPFSLSASLALGMQGLSAMCRTTTQQLPIQYALRLWQPLPRLKLQSLWTAAPVASGAQPHYSAPSHRLHYSLSQPMKGGEEEAELLSSCGELFLTQGLTPQEHDAYLAATHRPIDPVPWRREHLSHSRGMCIPIVWPLARGEQQQTPTQATKTTGMVADSSSSSSSAAAYQLLCAHGCGTYRQAAKPLQTMLPKVTASLLRNHFPTEDDGPSWEEAAGQIEEIQTMLDCYANW